MEYKIFTIADVHWGAMDADQQLDELKFIYEFLDKTNIDLLVIAGDYFDHRLLLNSKSCIYAIEMIDKLLSIAKDKSFIVRMFLGTKSHDYDQLDALSTLENDVFKIFKETTYEETLPGLYCIYCPDETMNNEDYLEKYKSIIFHDHTGKKFNHDIMFFHGSWDVILGDIIRDNENPNVVFEYSFFNNLCAVMVGGHWHDASEYGNVIYTRSTNRFKFEEDNPKGGVLLTFNTDDQSYSYERVVNPYATEYHTYIIDTSIFNTIEDYSLICNDAEEYIKNNPTAHVRFHILVTDEKEINKSCIESISFRFSKTKNTKVVIDNKLNKKRKEIKRKKFHDIKEKFSYLFDDSVSLSDKYRLFIKDTENVDIDTDQIKELLQKYI